MFKSKKNKEKESSLNIDNNEQLYNTYNLLQQNSNIDKEQIIEETLKENFSIFQESIKDINTLNISEKVNEYTKQQNLHNYDNNYIEYDYMNNHDFNYNNENYQNYNLNVQSYDNTNYQFENYNNIENQEYYTYNSEDQYVNDYNEVTEYINNYNEDNSYYNYNEQYTNQNEYVNQEEYIVEEEYVNQEEYIAQEQYITEETYVPTEEEIKMGKCQHCNTCIHKDTCEIYQQVRLKEEEMARMEREFEEKLRLERERLKALEELQAQQQEEQNVEYYNGEYDVESAVQNKIEENQFSNIYMEQNNLQENIPNQEDIDPERDYQHYQFRDYLSSDISLVGLADPKERFSAFMIDSLVLFVLYGLTYLLMLNDTVVNLVNMVTNNIDIYSFAMLSPYLTRFVSFFCVIIIIKFIYTIFIPLYLYKGKTLGKKIKNIQVKPANEDILDLDFNMLFKREIVGKFIGGLIFGVGYMRMFKNEDKKCYHDIYSETKVIKD